ncbi:MAG TPA: hypothetical protein VND99_03590 [Candidatus Acidoferrales bacterium]|nr:hypothetical protein [Candidatus Acidoferrales bacterium]
MSTTSSTDIIETMGQWFDKFPPLPKNVREILVTITPWIALIFGILGILGGIAGLGILTVFSPFAVLGGVSGYGNSFIAALIYLVSAILLLAAFPGTKAKKANGWKLFFWSRVVSLIGGLVGFAIVSAIIGALIGFYLLFQIKSYYK